MVPWLKARSWQHVGSLSCGVVVDGPGCSVSQDIVSYQATRYPGKSSEFCGFRKSVVKTSLVSSFRVANKFRAQTEIRKCSKSSAFVDIYKSIMPIHVQMRMCCVFAELSKTFRKHAWCQSCSFRCWYWCMPRSSIVGCDTVVLAPATAFEMLPRDERAVFASQRDTRNHKKRTHMSDPEDTPFQWLFSSETAVAASIIFNTNLIVV